ncbi:hypothetical protein [Streptomyces sp. TRM64462]|uniref:hypothetical protein n=1 Tax=Streptomyces sp. TRM64462 TaxID=2741726 RepID=UPI001586E8A8|nr:hypothetical protein [Streptomyces sp. TRM64462]
MADSPTTHAEYEEGPVEVRGARCLPLLGACGCGSGCGCGCQSGGSCQCGGCCG